MKKFKVRYYETIRDSEGIYEVIKEDIVKANNFIIDSNGNLILYNRSEYLAAYQSFASIKDITDE